MLVSEQIIQVLDNICSKFGLAIDWTSENILPYLTTLCTKLVSFEIWTSVAWLGITLVGFILVFTLMKKYSTGIKDCLTDEVLGPIVFILLFVLGAITIGAFISQIMDIIKCLTFPEMFVVEYIHNLMSNAG